MPARSEDWWRIRVLDDPEWSRDGGGIKMYVVVELDGRPAAYAMYRHHQRFEYGSTIGRVHVVEALAESPAATDALWRYLVGIDWVERLTCELLPVDHELHLMPSSNRRLRFTIDGGVLGPGRRRRPGRCRGVRTRATTRFVLEVADELCGWNVGRWHVSGAGLRGDAGGR